MTNWQHNNRELVKCSIMSLLLPQVITSNQQRNKDPINQRMKKVDLLKAHGTLCWGSQTTHVLEGQHTARRAVVYQRRAHILLLCRGFLSHVILKRGLFQLAAS